MAGILSLENLIALVVEVLNMKTRRESHQPIPVKAQG
jgi:hypothetical protein